MIEIKNPAPLPLTAKQNLLTEAEQRRLKLKKSTQQFEAIFIAQLLKNARSSSLNKEEENADGFGKEVMLAMADEGVSQQLAKTGKFGVGKVLYQHLIKRVDTSATEVQRAAVDKRPEMPVSLPRKLESVRNTQQAVAHRSLNTRKRPVSPARTPARAGAKVAARPASKSTTRSTAAVKTAVGISQRQVAGRSRIDNVSSETVVGKSEESPILSRYIEHIREAAQATQLSEDLLKSMIMRESAGNPHAVSRRGAAGLMQLMPDTAKAMGVTDRFDPKDNILGGAKYFRSLLNRFKDVKVALAAYNAGPTAVARHGGIPPFSETVKYVEGVLSDLLKGK